MSVPVSNRSASDGHAGLIRDIVDDLRESAAQSYEELSQATIDVLNRAADALESRPSLSVQSEEALADAWVETPIDTYADAENPALEWSRARMRAAILAACGVES